MAPNRRLKGARELKGWSQAKVAQQLGTDASTVSRWERGLFFPTPSFRERLCALFHKNAGELGLLEPDHAPKHEQSSYASQPPPAISSFHLQEEWSREGWPDRTIDSLVPPSWQKRTDTFTYILQSAAYNQQAHRLWKDAYVQALRGQRTEAQRLGEASLRAFERMGHLNAEALREWLSDLKLISSPPTAAKGLYCK